MAAHPIVHVEFSARDPEAAAQFYGDLFGWNLHTDPAFDYHMFQAEGGPGGGFVKIDGGAGDESSPYQAGDVLVYIASDDIEADLRKIEARGGAVVMPKTEIPNTGWFGIFRDPSGNKVALFTQMSQQS